MSSSAQLQDHQWTDALEPKFWRATQRRTISLTNGEVVEADLILGADGGRLFVPMFLVHHSSPSGVSCFRAVFELQENPDLLWLTGRDLQTGSRTFLAKEGPFRMFFVQWDPAQFNRLLCRFPRC
ncbi:hypothetical protein K438DRAFT_690372 [Mycena galopus ATCC 62051]|nr:hypothetical protein K438DRAFT_690372 [Mycena galopus ATCC 62051]